MAQHQNWGSGVRKTLLPSVEDIMKGENSARVRRLLMGSLGVYLRSMQQQNNADVTDLLQQFPRSPRYAAVERKEVLQKGYQQEYQKILEFVLRASLLLRLYLLQL